MQFSVSMPSADVDSAHRCSLPSRVLALAWCLLLLLTPGCGRAQPEEPGFTILEREMIEGVEQAYVSYPSGDLTVTGYLFVHPFSEKDVEPCLIFNHGGVGGVNEAAREKCRWLAKQGYIVFAPSFRGEDDSEGEVEVAVGEVDDVIAAMLLLKDHPGIVEGKFAMLGTSHGALISVKAAARPEVQGLLQVVVAAYGVMDIYSWYQHLLDNEFDVSDPLSKRIYGDGPQDKPEAFAARHALGLLPKLGDLPIFLVQGGLDEIVPKEQAVTMFNALRDAGRLSDNCQVYPHAGHGFLFWDDPTLHTQEELIDTEKAWQDILSFIDERVGEDDFSWE